MANCLYYVPDVDIKSYVNSAKIKDKGRERRKRIDHQHGG